MGELYTILNIEDNLENRLLIRRILQSRGYQVIEAENAAQAIDFVSIQRPDLILLDINMPDMDGITATETIRRKQPYVQIVILSVQNDSNYMQRAMRAGARDFLSKPPTGDELGAAIRRAGLMAIEERKKVITSAGPSTSDMAGDASGSPVYHGKIVMVYSPKGGTGCTTIATNLAISLANEETKVALVDGDLQFGDVAVFLNEQGKNTVLDLAPRADELDPDIVNEVMLTHAASRIKVLAAPSRPEMADGVTGEQFSKVLQYLRQLFSFVVVDTSSYLTDVVLSIIDISDLIVLITTQDIPAINNSKAFLSLIDGLKISRKRVLFVMNKYNKDIKITPEKIGESLKQKVGIVIPQDDKIVGNSINRGVPFILDNKTQPVGRSLM